MKDGSSFVGLDVHKAFIQVAVLRRHETAPLVWRIPNEPAKVSGLVRKLRRSCPGPLELCYEAGPCGFGLARQLNAMDGLRCVVIAPSLIPRKPGERIKTDRRDAIKLASLHRAGLLTDVQPPSPGQEALRDLSRRRASIRDDLKSAKQQLGKFLLRNQRTFTGTKQNWTTAHFSWLQVQRFEEPTHQFVFDDMLDTVQELKSRLGRVEQHMQDVSQEEPLKAPVALLQCFKGFKLVSAMSVATELYCFERFQSPRGLMAFVGLVPSEHSSGGQAKRGGITKSGNGRLRMLLIEAAQNCVRSSRTGIPLRKRRQGQPQWAVQIAERAQRRLFARYRRLTMRGKHHNTAVTAVARELLGFIWAMLTEHRLRSAGAYA